MPYFAKVKRKLAYKSTSVIRGFRLNSAIFGAIPCVRVCANASVHERLLIS